MRVLIDYQIFHETKGDQYFQDLVNNLTKLNNVEVSLLLDASCVDTVKRANKDFFNLNVQFVYWYSLPNSNSCLRSYICELNNRKLYSMAICRQRPDIFIFFSSLLCVEDFFFVKEIPSKIKLICLRSGFDGDRNRNTNTHQSGHTQRGQRSGSNPLLSKKSFGKKLINSCCQHDITILDAADFLNDSLQSILTCPQALREEADEATIYDCIDRFAESVAKYKHKNCELTEFSRAITNQLYRRVYVDISGTFNGVRMSGIPRVVKNISNLLPKKFPSNIEVVFVGWLNGSFQAYEFHNSSWVAKGIIKPNPNDIFLLLSLNAELAYYESYFDTYKEINVKFVTIVYDLVYYLHPEVVANSAYVLCLNKWLEFVVKRSDLLVCISQSVADELRSWCLSNSLSQHVSRIDYFYLGSDLTGKAIVQKVRTSTRKFLAVSTLEPRKGYDTILDAFEILFETDNVELHIVGRMGWKCSNLCQRIKGSKFYNKQLFWHEGATDEELLNLYRDCDAYVNASIYEGFGLPIVEAAKFGLPLILRDLAVFRELAGDSASYFSSADELIGIVRKFIRSPESIQLLPLSKLINWEDSVSWLVKLIEKYTGK